MENKIEITNVIVHPIVLLSIVDHFNRIAKGTTNKRVVGTLLGEIYEDSNLKDDEFSTYYRCEDQHLPADDGLASILASKGTVSLPSSGAGNKTSDNNGSSAKNDAVSVKDTRTPKRYVYLHVTNSFAVPFDEDPKDPEVWFFDTSYHSNLFQMFKKVNVRERIVGWYSTGPKIKPADLEIHQIYTKYCAVPICLIVDVMPKDLLLPVNAYYSIKEPTSDKAFRRTFVHIPSTIGAYEAEEVGVEYLLRELRNASTSTLANQVSDKLNSLRFLISKLKEISDYIQLVIEGLLPSNPKILYNLQNIVNLLSDMENAEIVSAFCVQTNDAFLVIYLGSIFRAIMGLHGLINNMIENKKKYAVKIKEGKCEEKDFKKENEKNKILRH